MLPRKALSFITKQFCQGEMNLLATRANKELNKYISWKPDVDSIATDAFSVTWENTLIIVSFVLVSFGEYWPKRKGINQCNTSYTSLANTKLVSSNTQNYGSNTNYQQQQSFTITGSKPKTPPIPTTGTCGFSFVAGYIKTHEISQSYWHHGGKQ